MAKENIFLLLGKDFFPAGKPVMLFGRSGKSLIDKMEMKGNFLGGYSIKSGHSPIFHPGRHSHKDSGVYL